MIKRRFVIVFFIVVLAITAGLWWYPQLNQQFYRWFPLVGRPYQANPGNQPAVEIGKPEPICSDERPEWRAEQVVDGLTVEASAACNPDDPYAVAAFVKGTNNVSMDTLMKAGLSPDTVVLTDDRDGDGDPDDVHIRLEVAELNGRSPDLPFPVPGYSIAPGIQPGFWVFAPKTHGMVTKDFVSYEATPMIRAPSPTIRVEVGDRVRITLENTHYLPHTIHLHGVDHPYYLDHPMHGDKRGNDGVPETSHIQVMPGESFTYEITPRVAGTQLYHCHEQAPVHVAMGLMGLFVVEENRPNNWVQTINVGAGHVRHSSVAVRETYAREYDLIYQAFDRELNDLIKTSNDARVIGYLTSRVYDPTRSEPEYFILNGRSFPYTLRESIIAVPPNAKVKLRMANVGDDRSIAIHTHGHKLKITHYDGVPHNPSAWIQRDTFDLAPAQRNDLELATVDDGLNSYGPGVWMMHDHAETAITTNGQFPGGNITMIVYDDFLTKTGLPMTHGMDLNPFFTKEFYERKVPVWMTVDKEGILMDPAPQAPALTRPVLLAFAIGLLLGGAVFVLRSAKRRAETKV